MAIFIYEDYILMSRGNYLENEAVNLEVKNTISLIIVTLVRKQITIFISERSTLDRMASHKYQFKQHFYVCVESRGVEKSNLIVLVL